MSDDQNHGSHRHGASSERARRRDDDIGGIDETARRPSPSLDLHHGRRDRIDGISKRVREKCE